jgi:tRNA(Ile)-lysidine synthase
MKIHFIDRPPQSVYVAFSGGVDSVVLTHILKKRRFDVTLLNVHHNNDFADVEQDFTIKIANQYHFPFELHHLPEYDKSTSLESFWSRHRNDIFQKANKMVLTGHHLDDAVEWYLMSSFQGTPKILDVRNRNVLRPLLGVTKDDIMQVAQEFNLEYLTDPTNSLAEFNLRNNVRLNLIPNVKQCFPGINKTVRRLVIDKHRRSMNNGDELK